MMIRQKMQIYQGQSKGCPYMFLEIEVNQYIKLVLISTKRFKNKIFRLIAVQF